MAKTKAQKAEIIDEGGKAFKGSESLVLADFTGLPVNQTNTFRKSLKAIGASFMVVKKRLLKLIFEKEGIEFDPKKFGGQMGVVFSPKDMVETAGTVYKFSSKQKDLFKILGGFELKEKKFLEGADVKRIGQLPSREVLLGQLVYMLGTPIRSFLFVLNEKAKKGSNTSQ